MIVKTDRSFVGALKQSERSGAPGQTARCDSWWAAPGPRRAAGRPGRGPRPARRWRRSARPRGPAPRRGSAARTRPARSTQPPPPLRGREGYIVCVNNINIASLLCSLIILSFTWKSQWLTLFDKGIFSVIRMTIEISPSSDSVSSDIIMTSFLIIFLE